MDKQTPEVQRMKETRNEAEQNNGKRRHVNG